jgi:predicted ABC-class ATPase
MEQNALDAAFRSFLVSWAGDTSSIDTPYILPVTTAFLVRSFDGEALQFSFSLLIRRDLIDEIGLAPAGSDGAVCTLIEHIKEQAQNVPELGPLYGKGISGSVRYHDTIEPCTIIHSDDAIGSHLWKADSRNFCDRTGIHLIMHGAIPCPPVSPAKRDTLRIFRHLGDLAETTATLVQNVPANSLVFPWLASLDQKLLREDLGKMGLVSFVGDGSKLARNFTRNRPFFRIAGPKEGVSVSFRCPEELEPVELYLKASYRTVTGIGIKKQEILAVAGSNAQGKTTFLEGILAGMDDHAPHDGRDLVVTVRGAGTAESSNLGLAGADISMFFHSLPPGVSGTVHAAHGMGSGSMAMAHQIQYAIARHIPLLIIDEDRAAPNLLVKSCLQGEEVTPLAEILSRERGLLGQTSLVFAACAMDTLIAQADRIMVLDRHVAKAIDPLDFRHTLAEMLRRTADELE